jgi:hypothetical protein
MSALAIHGPTEPSFGQRLKDDNRGAIMMMGLFMACFLVGAMWFMKGIGDAIVFKDRMQEGADHVAFTSAVIHARGMNVIAILNILMYVIALIWVIICLLKDFLELACHLLEVCMAAVVTTPICGTLYGIAKPADTAVGIAKTAYENTAVKLGLPALSFAGTAAAIGYPWYGTYAGYTVGKDYNGSGMAVGPSNIPGFTFKLPLDKFFGGKKPPSVPGKDLSAGAPAAGGTPAAPAASPKPTSFNMKLGLPVVLGKNKELCERFTGGLKSFFPGFLGRVVSWVGGRFTEARGYCSAKMPWDDENYGYKKMYSPAQNGNDWMQVWSFMFPDKYDEGFAESKVALSMGTKLGVPAATAARGDVPSGSVTTAQAEFYYDCQATWKDTTCNGEAPDHTAVFNMRWMARQRRVKTPSIGQLLGGAISDLFLGPLMTFVGGKITKPIQDFIGKDSLGKDFLNKSIDKFTKDAVNAGKGKINDAIGIPSPVGATIPEIIH